MKKIDKTKITFALCIITSTCFLISYIIEREVIKLILCCAWIGIGYIYLKNISKK